MVSRRVFVCSKVARTYESRLTIASTEPDFGDGMAGYDLDNNADQTRRHPDAADGNLLTPVTTVLWTANLGIALEPQGKDAGTSRNGRAGIYREGTGPAY